MSCGVEEGRCGQTYHQLSLEEQVGVVGDLLTWPGVKMRWFACLEVLLIGGKLVASGTQEWAGTFGVQIACGRRGPFVKEPVVGWV